MRFWNKQSISSFCNFLEVSARAGLEPSNLGSWVDCSTNFIKTSQASNTNLTDIFKFAFFLFPRHSLNYVEETLTICVVAAVFSVIAVVVATDVIIVAVVLIVVAAAVRREFWKVSLLDKMSKDLTPSCYLVSLFSLCCHASFDATDLTLSNILCITFYVDFTELLWIHI